MLWIGFNDIAKEGSFVWSSGEKVTFKAWASGEPNNVNGNEDFVTIYPGNHPSAGKWNDWVNGSSAAARLSTESSNWRPRWGRHGLLLSRKACG